jgi:hypothetical protein
MTTTADLKTGRTRSVDNLQRLYTVVISLALTEYLRRLLTDVVTGPSLPGYNRWLMFVSLVFTVVPFYHGANRYLDATYVTGERSAHRGALMIDFLVLFVEGLGFFAVAMLAFKGREYFYTGLAALFVLDAGWVWLTNLMASSPEHRMAGFTPWAMVNVVAAALLCIFVWSAVLGHSFWNTAIATNIALMIVTISRTIYDYHAVWNFYYPKDSTDFEMGLPAPPPAPPPHLSL